MGIGLTDELRSRAVGWSKNTRIFLHPASFPFWVSAAWPGRLAYLLNSWRTTHRQRLNDKQGNPTLHPRRTLQLSDNACDSALKVNYASAKTENIFIRLWL